MRRSGHSWQARREGSLHCGAAGDRERESQRRESEEAERRRPPECICAPTHSHAHTPTRPTPTMDSQTSLTPPTRFAYVNPGVSRGAYPTLRNFRFLSRLQLKTIVSLTPEPPTADLVLFADMAGIQLVHLQVTRLCPLSEGLQETLVNAVNVSVDVYMYTCIYVYMCMYVCMYVYMYIYRSSMRSM
jgi:hypothetical protein